MKRTLRALLTPALLLIIVLCGAAGCKTGEELVLPQQYEITNGK